MSIYVTRIEAYDIHNRFTIKQSFDAGLNIIYGNNGSGKTTLLHILANILTGDYRRLKYIQFSRIIIEFSNKVFVNITRSERFIYIDFNGEKDTIQLSSNNHQSLILKKGKPVGINSLREKITNNNILFKIEYFPAFRTMIEAWASMHPHLKEDYIAESLINYRSNIDTKKMNLFH